MVWKNRSIDLTSSLITAFNSKVVAFDEGWPTASSHLHFVVEFL